MAPTKKQLKQLRQKNEQLEKESTELRARLRLAEEISHIDKVVERKTNKQLKNRVRKSQGILRLHGLEDEIIEPQDIVDWLTEQHQAPHPLYTSTDTMMMWLQAMNTKLSRHDLESRVDTVMQLWREQANPSLAYTRDQQDKHNAVLGANMRPVVLTITWQQWQEHLLLKEEEEEKEEEQKSPEPAYQASFEPQDIVDWLRQQQQAPHPLNTSTETMMRWLEAMDTGVSRNTLQRHIGPVMELWRQQGTAGLTFTAVEQARYIAEHGANSRPVVLTMTWQQHLQAKKAEEEQEKEEESMNEEERPFGRLDFTSVQSIDTSPVDPVLFPTAFNLEFTLNIAPFTPGFGPTTPLTEHRPQFRAHTASSSPSTLSLSPEAYETIEGSPVRPAPGPHRYASGPLPDLFPGYAELGPVNPSGAAQTSSQQQTGDEYLARQLHEAQLVERLEQRRSPHVSVLPSRLPGRGLPSHTTRPADI